MNRIAIVVPWFGKIPSYFPFFIKGLENNKNTLDILFFTDEVIEYKTPSNFKIIELNWEGLKNRIKTKIGKEENIQTPYKLCDLKPMYGKMFETELENYEYWGYGDIDLIYGDLERFLPFNGTENYDVITFRENIMHGPFSLFKNNDYTRNLYQKTNKLKEIISTPEYIGFDEAGRAKPWRDGLRLYDKIEIDGFWDWSCIVQQEADTGKLKLFERYYCLEYILYDSILEYKNGMIKIGMEEYAFFHFVAHKKQKEFKTPHWESIPDIFFAHKTGFYKKLNLYFLIQKNLRVPIPKLLNFIQKVKDSINYRLKKK